MTSGSDSYRQPPTGERIDMERDELGDDSRSDDSVDAVGQRGTGLARSALGIDHIAIAVHDLETSIRFFTQVLGFEIKERRRTEGISTAMTSSVLIAGPLTFVLLQGTTPESQVSRFVEHYGAGVQHIAIAVSDLPELVSELTTAGMNFDTTIIESPGLRQIFSKRDPGSGTMLEIIERRGGDLSDAGVQQLFDQLEAQESF